MAAVTINFAANGSQESRAADMGHRHCRRPGIGSDFERIEQHNARPVFDLSHGQPTGCAGNSRSRRLTWIKARKNQRSNDSVLQSEAANAR
jgi:hypothetical protein